MLKPYNYTFETFYNNSQEQGSYLHFQLFKMKNNSFHVKVAIIGEGYKTEERASVRFL